MYGFRTEIDNVWANPEMHCEKTSKCGKDQSAGWKKKKTAGDEKLIEEFESRDIRIKGNQPVDHSTGKREEMFVNNLTPRTPEGVSESIGNKLFSSEIWGEVVCTGSGDDQEGAARTANGGDE